MIRLGYVYCQPVSKEQSSFAGHVPLRMAALLAGDVELHIFYQGALEEEPLKAAGVHVHQISARTKRHPVHGAGLDLYRSLGPLVEQAGVDVLSNVWAHYALAPVHRAAEYAGVPVIGRIAGVPIRGTNASWLGRLRHRIGRLVELYALRRCSAIHVLSDELAAIMQERGLPRERIHVIPQGIDSDRFRAEEPPKNEPLEVLFVGRLVANKRVEDALQAVRMARDAGHDVRITVIGGGPRRRALEALTTEAQLKDHVDFLGHQSPDEVAAALRAANVLVLPSDAEGLPNVVLEAMASVRPVISTPAGSCPQLLADGRGIIVPHRSPQSIAQALMSLDSDRRGAVRMGKKAGDYVRDRYDMGKVRHAYLEMMYSILEAKP